MLKLCSACRIDKPLDEFYNYKGGRLGKTSQCRECHDASLLRSKARKEAGLPRPERTTIKPDADFKGEYLCIRCNETKPVSAFRPTKAGKRKTIGSYCIECHNIVGRANNQKQRAADPLLYWARSAFHASVQRALQKGLAHTLTIPEIIQIATPGACEYCGYRPSFSRTRDLDRRTAPSLDRLCPKDGYTAENTIFSCLRCNMIKNEASPEDLKRIYEKTVELFAVRRLQKKAV